MKKLSLILLSLVLVCCCVVAVACDKTITVVYHLNNGQNDVTQQYEGAISLPENPTKADHSFTGWFVDEQCASEFVNEGKIPAELHLYAGWKFEGYTVSFDLGYDGATPIDPITGIQEGGKIKLPAEDPVRDGYKFNGWYTAAEGGEKWANRKTVEQSMTLYAQWTAQATITFTANFSGGEDFTKEVEKGTKFPSVDAPERSTDYKFLGWFTAPEGGKKVTRTTVVEANMTVYAQWHQHDFNESYFLFVECAECGDYGRAAHLGTYQNVFVYNFDETRKADIQQLYQNLLDSLTGDSFETCESLFEQYDEQLYYIMEQYQYAYVFKCAYEEEEYQDKFDFVSEFYNDSVADYYKLFRIFYESKFGEQFYEGNTEAEIAELLALSDSYGDSEDQNEQDAIIKDWEEATQSSSPDMGLVNSLYKRLVVVNNKIAVKAGYENYMDYAYAVRYSRDYSPEDVASMRNYVRNIVAPLFMDITAQYMKLGSLSVGPDLDLYNAMTVPLWASGLDSHLYSAMYGAELLNDYLQFVTDADATAPNAFNFAPACYDLFKNGNYYLGKNEQGAFSYYIPAQDSTILYFGNGYQGAFTFMHEFGHYFENVYNPGLNLSMDHDETQSQGNEMLLLAWLSENCGEATVGYNNLMVETLFDSLATIVIATAVDEFEQAAYTGFYNGNPVDTNNYGGLFETILKTYGDGENSAADYLNTSYWAFTTFDSAGYYISYAMSALPSFEIFLTAQLEGLDVAKECYKKLFTFSNEPGFVNKEDGEVLVTYQEILTYAGLQGPFQAGLYTKIQQYFNPSSEL